MKVHFFGFSVTVMVIDKEGSLLFYRDGVHIRMLLHPLAWLLLRRLGKRHQGPRD